MIDLKRFTSLRIVLICAAGAAFGGLGCDGDESGSSGDTTTATVTQEPTGCTGDARAQTYTVGLEGAPEDGALTITFMDADPAPPAKGDNTWMVQIKDSAGKPVNDATIETKAYMPDHGHGSTSQPKATAMGSDGTYEVKPVNLFMPGIWEVTLTVTPAGGTAHAVAFTFCVPG